MKMAVFWDVAPSSLVGIEMFRRSFLPPSSGLHSATSQETVIVLLKWMLKETGHEGVENFLTI
jgi:hypothetical protein